MTGRIVIRLPRLAGCRALLAIALAGFGCAAQAQTPQMRNYRPDPVTQDRSFQGSPLQPNADRGAKPTVEVPTLRAPSAAALPGSALPSFRLTALAVEGAMTVPPEAIAATYAERVGTLVTVADIAAIADAITALYRNAGYHLSRAIVPPQDIRDGRIRITVIEGSIEDVVVRGPGKDLAAVRAMLAPVAAERPAQRKTLERALLNINDLPGFRVADSTLEEIGTASGRFRLLVIVEAWKLYWSQGIDNFGSTSVGPLQAYSSLAVNSLFIGGDTLAVAGSTVPDDTNALAFGRAVYDMPIGTDGARFGASVLQSATRPAETRFLRDTARTTTYELRGSILPLQTRATSLRLTAAASTSDITEGLTLGTLYHDHINTVSLAADLRMKDDFNGWNYLTLIVRQGFGGTRSNDIMASIYGASGDFTALNGAYVRIQKLTDAWSLKFAGTAQIASGPMLLSQQYFLGAAAFGPGYYTNDNGIGGTLELRWDQDTNWALLKGYQLYGFTDGGQVWSSHGGNYAALASVGAGARFFINEQLQAGVAVAFPVYNQFDNGDLRDYRILFSVLNAFKMCPSRPDLLCG